MRALMCRIVVTGLMTLLPLEAMAAPEAAKAPQAPQGADANAAPTPAASPGPEIAAEFRKMTAALADRDYATFIANGTEEAKTNFTEALFGAVSDQVSDRLKNGYTATYLTQLRQQGCDVYVWKVTMKDGGDDFLIKLALQDKKVAGFRIQ